MVTPYPKTMGCGRSHLTAVTLNKATVSDCCPGVEGGGQSTAGVAAAWYRQDRRSRVRLQPRERRTRPPPAAVPLRRVNGRLAGAAIMQHHHWMAKTK